MNGGVEHHNVIVCRRIIAHYLSHIDRQMFQYFLLGSLQILSQLSLFAVELRDETCSFAPSLLLVVRCTKCLPRRQFAAYIFNLDVQGIEFTLAWSKSFVQFCRCSLSFGSRPDCLLQVDCTDFRGLGLTVCNTALRESGEKTGEAHYAQNTSSGFVKIVIHSASVAIT